MGAKAINDDFVLVDKRDIIEIKSMLKLLVPPEFTIAYVALISGKSKQAVLQWLERNAEPEVDYYKKGAKIIISEKMARTYMSTRRQV